MQIVDSTTSAKAIDGHGAEGAPAIGNQQAKATPSHSIADAAAGGVEAGAMGTESQNALNSEQR